jgi:peptidoglycan/xylan/chitin deacetylase (PgdA/CDA1 family)
MYHSISQHAMPKFRQFTVSASLFAEQMAYLHKQGYTPITVTQFVTMRSHNHAALPEHPVILTFDDGFADFYDEALPVLKQYDFLATLYVTTAFVNGTSRWLVREGETKRLMLSWQQLLEISAQGIECGAHSHSHPQLDVLDNEAARHEILQSKRILEEQLDQEVLSFAYPFGYYTGKVQQLVQFAGYTSACAVKHAICTETDSSFSLPRLMIGANTSMKEFAALLKGQSSSPATAVNKMYAQVRTHLWQGIRRCNATLTQYLQRGRMAKC